MDIANSVDGKIKRRKVTSPYKIIPKKRTLTYKKSAKLLAADEGNRPKSTSHSSLNIQNNISELFKLDDVKYSISECGSQMNLAKSLTEFLPIRKSDLGDHFTKLDNEDDDNW